jgi:thioredoxin reductase (NADPH)
VLAAFTGSTEGEIDTMAKKLIVIGGGPSGLSAAINAASEGVDVTLIERVALGGQFKESNDIENYPGFPSVTGFELSKRMIEQASKFNVDFQCPVSISGVEERDGKIVAIADDYREFEGDALVLAVGVQWRRLEAPGVASLIGRGVSYGAPSKPLSKTAKVVIVGGGNSAGQEAVKLASEPGRKVTIVVRHELRDLMSTYLDNKIAALPNITVLEHTEVSAAQANAKGELCGVSLTTAGYDKAMQEPCDTLLLYIGAQPHTFWLKGSGVEVDPFKFIKTGDNLNGVEPFETNVPGIFAIGDARSGSCKRIGAAVGEGSTVIPYVHKFLAEQQEKKSNG